MSEFDKWAVDGGLSVVKFPMSNIYKDTDTRIASVAWTARQSEIDQLKAEKEKLEIELTRTKQVLNNVIDMERNKVDQLKAEKAGLEKRIDGALEITSRTISSKGVSVAVSTCRGLCLDLEKTLRGAHE